MAFSMHFSPRAAGRRRQARRLRRLPVGGPPLGALFFVQNELKLMTEHRKLTDFCLQTSLTIVPTDPIDVTCVSDLPMCA